MQIYLVSFSLLALWVAYTVVKVKRNPLSAIPGPWYSKWTDMVLTYQWLRGKRTAYVQQLHEEYGKVVRISPYEVDFSSISAAKQIHSFTRPLTKTNMYDAFRNANGSCSVFDLRDLKQHARHRRLLLGSMSEASLKSVEHIVQERTALAMEKMGLEMKNKGAVDVLKWWMFFSSDVIGELTFGDSFRMLEQGQMNQYTSDLSNLTKMFGVRMAFPRLIMLASYIPLPLFSSAVTTHNRMNTYAVESIRRYEKAAKAEPHNPKPTLFTKMFNANEETLPHVEVVANAQAYIIAGSDTTASSLTYLVWAVCRDPSIKSRLAAELGALPDGVKDEDLKALPYLNQVIQETLRCYAAAPANLPRNVPAGGCEIDGYWMPEGTEVQTQAYSMHRDPVVYPEPERFNPSRWESPSKDMKDAFMPFGGGARTCIGMHLARMELRIATAKFFRAYPNAKLSTLDGFCDEDMEQIIFFLIYPKNKRCLIQAL
ncbi:cytochrome protein [Clathrospora elynae]|uniref:Cytochrome protein n=1 Tax=Clathrospora elynae TaxID=706981 RepID=A0A6A5SNA6_9PLEO|nr:cytochrome protein [Clathrospora elynae]